jgi:adenosylmethionine-8-amino-7-oxononanoate aminotransferase
VIHSSPVWHPFTQHALAAEMTRITKTEGAYLFTETGERIFDAISSWWVITHQHRHPFIMNAIRGACEQWDQIIFAEFTHEPAEELARELLSLAPTGLQHVFYSDSGSTAVEVALKMALGYFKHSGAPRTRIVVMEHGYHGDTIGAMSVGERGAFNAVYEPLLFKVDRIPFPLPGYEQDTLDAFEKYCMTGQVAALLLEPLILGAGGFKCYPAWLLTELKHIAEKYSSLLIADEVMTGWGRTGSLFACEQAGISPDILCTSKGLTGGSLPLAATLCCEKIFNAHFSTDRRKTFFHSSSYTANPIACAAALANIEIWKTEPVLERIAQITKTHQSHLAVFNDDCRFTSVRQIGTIAALDINTESCGYFSNVATRLRTFFRQRNLLIRPLGNVIYLMPPYCVTPQELQDTYAAIDESADMLMRSTA